MSDFLTALTISGSGLSAQRTRVTIASSNLANAESTRGPDGQPYRRRDPVLEATAFDQALDADGQPRPGEPAAAVGVQVAQVVEAPTPGRRGYLPGHPDADADGFVTFPNVNPLNETVNLMTASRGYEANAPAVDTLKTMAQRAVDIAR